MLSKIYRLSKTQLTPSAISHTIPTPYFSIKQWKNDVGYHRFGFIISKKIDKRAVVRNSLKRKMADAVSVLISKDQGYDMTLYMKKTAVTASIEELQKALLAAKA